LSCITSRKDDIARDARVRMPRLYTAFAPSMERMRVISIMRRICACLRLRHAPCLSMRHHCCAIRRQRVDASQLDYHIRPSTSIDHTPSTPARPPARPPERPLPRLCYMPSDARHAARCHRKEMPMFARPPMRCRAMPLISRCLCRFPHFTLTPAAELPPARAPFFFFMLYIIFDFC